MSEASAVGDLEGRSPAEEASQEPDHESKYLAPNKEILKRNLEHMLVWLQGQPHGTQSRAPHSIVTGRSSIQIKGKDGRTVIFQVDSKLDGAASKKIDEAIQHSWKPNFSRGIGGDILDKSGRPFNRRVQTRFDKFEMYDFDLYTSKSKLEEDAPQDKNEDTDWYAPAIQVACVPMWDWRTRSFVVRSTSLPKNHSKVILIRRKR